LGELTPRQAKRVRAWQPVRRRGLWHFMLVRGVAGWGLVMFAILGVGTPLLRGQGLMAEQLVFSAVLWTVSGLYWGWSVYAFSDWYVARLEARDR
jgi:hypothetical protein